jgi:predicted acylesterase/phospholipase RssA
MVSSHSARCNPNAASEHFSKPKIGLALGGGGVRAFIYVGIYEVFKENDIPISMVTGTSMGSILGAAIALGYPPEKIKAFATSYKDKNFFSLKNFNYLNESIVKSEAVSEMLEEFFGDKTFADTIMPFTCSAVDLENRQRVMFDSGLISKATMASSAYPLIFPPVFYDERYFIDGGVLDQVPAKECRELGAEKLIAVNIKNNVVPQHIAGHIFRKQYLPEFKDLKLKRKGAFGRKKDDLKFMVDLILESVNIAGGLNVTENLKVAKPEILLEPIVNAGFLDFSKSDQLIEQGRELATEILPQVKGWL